MNRLPSINVPSDIAKRITSAADQLYEENGNLANRTSKMSENMPHIVAANRMNNTSVIVGDRSALTCLRDAIEQALVYGSGGARLLASDGEAHNIAVVFESNIYPVYTSYANEVAPARSRRETVQLEQLRHYPAAVGKATGTVVPSCDDEDALATATAK